MLKALKYRCVIVVWNILGLIFLLAYVCVWFQSLSYTLFDIMKNFIFNQLPVAAGGFLVIFPLSACQTEKKRWSKPNITRPNTMYFLLMSFARAHKSINALNTFCGIMHTINNIFFMPKCSTQEFAHRCK